MSDERKYCGSCPGCGQFHRCGCCGKVDELTAKCDRLAAEKASAVNDIVELARVIKGSDRPPTLAEIEAHEARGGDWWIFQRRGDARPRPRRVLLLVRDGEVICDVDGAPSEIPTDAGTWWAWLDGPVAWPTT